MKLSSVSAARNPASLRATPFHSMLLLSVACFPRVLCTLLSVEVLPLPVNLYLKGVSRVSEEKRRSEGGQWRENRAEERANAKRVRVRAERTPLQLSFTFKSSRKSRTKGGKNENRRN